jgi:hypothetical protein
MHLPVRIRNWGMEYKLTIRSALLQESVANMLPVTPASIPGSIRGSKFGSMGHHTLRAAADRANRLGVALQRLWTLVRPGIPGAVCGVGA